MTDLILSPQTSFPKINFFKNHKSYLTTSNDVDTDESNMLTYKINQIKAENQKNVGVVRIIGIACIFVLLYILFNLKH